MRLSPNLLAAVAFSGILGVSSRVNSQPVPAQLALDPLDGATEEVKVADSQRTTVASTAEDLVPAVADTDLSLETTSLETTPPPITAFDAAAADGIFMPEGAALPTEALRPQASPERNQADMLTALESSIDGATKQDTPDGELDTGPDPDIEIPVEPEPSPTGEDPQEDAEAEEGTDEDSRPEFEFQDEEEQAEEPRVLVAEVAVEGADDILDEALLQEVYDAVDTVPGRTTTRSQLQRDINNIFATGFFSNVRAVPEDTPLGVRVTFIVQPNPVLQDVQVVGNQVLPESKVEEIFAPQYGEIINLIEFQDGIIELNEWYQENGYVLAQVIAAPQVSDDGVVTLEVAEGVVEDIEVQFVTSDGDTEDEEGNPVQGRTRDFIVTREFQTESGDVFNQSQIERDLQQVFDLGIFEDVRLSLEPGEDDPRKVNVVVNVTERNTGSVAAGLGFNFTGDIFGTVSYRQDNFGGNNQKFSAEAQLSTRDLLFDISFTDPWIAGDPYRTSYTANLFARRSINLNFDGGTTPIDLDNGDRVRVRRIGSGISFSRPLSGGWTVSVGTEFQNVSTRDAGGGLAARDAAGNPLTLSSTGIDDLWTVPVSAVLDRRNDSFNPTSGSILRLTSEQSVPLGRGSIFMNRLRASYSYYLPVDLISFTEGPQALALNVQGGTVLGDLPPYEAFALGGTNSVRGYDEGDVGSGRSYVQMTAEYRFPLFSFLGAALFVDAASDLGSGFAVPGAPGPDRGKPGGGFGYGGGLRIQTPLGPIRVDYGINDQGDGRLHFGIGERF